MIFNCYVRFIKDGTFFTFLFAIFIELPRQRLDKQNFSKVQENLNLDLASLLVALFLNFF